MTLDLFERSRKIILSNQHPSGAYVACPNFPTYQYSWFRDGAYIAHAMVCIGERDSAWRFHDWAAGVILRHADRAKRAIAKGVRGLPLEAGDILHTRYTLDGDEVQGVEWPNFQLDGFGTWLWAMDEFARHDGQPLPETWRRAAGITADYLAAFWERPCYDCWEEFPEKIHTHTLAAVFAGLVAHQRLANFDNSLVLVKIRHFIETELTYNGCYVKYHGSQAVDASLLGLSVPYRVAAPEAGTVQKTVEQIERTLQMGGVHRYPTDTYYGGGEWVLLAGWLGWLYAETGRLEAARRLLLWMESQADEVGNLPEQVPQTLIEPSYYPVWVRQWGAIASPLLWSHAMYLILAGALGRGLGA